MQLADETHPSRIEIEAWAYSGDPPPVADWEAVLADVEYVDLLVGLVDDPHCPARREVLASLYCLVAHTDRTDPRLLDAVATAASSPNPWLKAWARRTSRVLEDPTTFVHRDWCGGAFAGAPEG